MPKNSHSAFAWLRSALLRRAVAWGFLLAIGLAHASPLIKPQSLELLCSGSGAMKLLIKSADGDAQESTHTGHCGLCASNTLGDGLPPTVSGIPVKQLATHAQPRALASAPAAQSLPTLPARGPPDFS